MPILCIGADPSGNTNSGDVELHMDSVQHLWDLYALLGEYKYVYFVALVCCFYHCVVRTSLEYNIYYGSVMSVTYPPQSWYTTTLYVPLLIFHFVAFITVLQD